MNRAELRSLRLSLIDGRRLTNEQALAVVSALEEVVGIIEKETGSLDPNRVDAFTSHLNPKMCPVSQAGEKCPNASPITGIRIALRRAGPIPGGA